jgi:integrase
MKRGNITKRGKNSWQLKFDAGTIDGKRQQRYATVKGSRQDAQKELTRLLGEADKGMLPTPTQDTVAEYVRHWLDTATGRTPMTMERWRELAAHQINPHLGAVPLQRLMPEAIRAWHAALLGKGLSARTVRHAHQFLRQVLTTAVKDGKLARNVAGVHKPPKVEHSEIEILNSSDIERVQTLLRGHVLETVVSLALATGMRRGELCGLQWGDVNLDAGTLTVRRSIEETKALGIRIKEPKSKSGRRCIALPPAAVAMLREYKVRRLEFHLATGAGKLADDAFVFPDPKSGEGLLKPSKLTNGWRRSSRRMAFRT